MWITFVIMIVLFLIDQGTKICAELFLNTSSNVGIDNFLTFTLCYNPGAAFGIGGSSGTIIFVCVSTLASLLLGYLCMKNDWKKGKIGAIGMTLAFVGCASNLIDRVLTLTPLRSGVVDMVSFKPFDWFMGLFRAPASIFNVADMFLIIGLIMVCIDYLFIYDKRVVKKNGPKNRRK